jgi:hypothetical protein
MKSYSRNDLPKLLSLPSLPSLHSTLQHRNHLPVQQIPRVYLTVLAAADDIGVIETKAGADAVVRIDVGRVGLEDRAVAFVEETDGRVKCGEEKGVCVFGLADASYGVCGLELGEIGVIG